MTVEYINAFRDEFFSNAHFNVESLLWDACCEFLDEPAEMSGGRVNCKDWVLEWIIENGEKSISESCIEFGDEIKYVYNISDLRYCLSSIFYILCYIYKLAHESEFPFTVHLVFCNRDDHGVFGHLRSYVSEMFREKTCVRNITIANMVRS